MNRVMGGEFERQEADSRMFYNKNKGTQSCRAMMSQCHTSALDNEKIHLLLFEPIQNDFHKYWYFFNVM